MSENTRGRVPRAIAVAVAPVLVTASAFAIANGAAGASTSSHGKLRVCSSSTQTKLAKFTIHRTHYTKRISLHMRAHHTVCSASYSVKKGGYSVTQLASAGTKVTHVSASPKSRAGAHKASWIHAAVASRHTTSVHFSSAAVHINAPKAVTPVAPTPTPAPTSPSDPGTGYLEVCKFAADSYVTGLFNITITDGSYSKTVNLPLGQCTDALQVPIGTATITEKPNTNTYLYDVTSNSGSLVKHLDTSSATVDVPSSANSANEVRVNLFNAYAMGSFKVCKTLTGNADALHASGNDTFTFDTSFTYKGEAYTNPVTVSVPTTGDTYCTPVDLQLPVGTKVTVTEENHNGSMLVSAGTNPSSQDAGSSGSTVRLYIGPDNGSIVKAEFVNAAVGTIEICKRIDDQFWNDWYVYDGIQGGGDDDWQDSPYNGTPFQFSINGGSPITVKAGYCSAPISVPAGTATVSELSTPNFNFEKFEATGPDGSSRILSGTNPITVSVPAGGVGNETLVIATNKVQTAQVKVCKISNLKLGRSYDFDTRFSIDNGDNWLGQDVTLTPEEQGPDGEVCSYLSYPVPVIDEYGNPVKVTAREGKTGYPYADNGTILAGPTSITYDGNGYEVSKKEAYVGESSKDDGCWYLTAVVGQGVNVITFTNNTVVDP